MFVPQLVSYLCMMVLKYLILLVEIQEIESQTFSFESMYLPDQYSCATVNRYGKEAR